MVADALGIQMPWGAIAPSLHLLDPDPPDKVYIMLFNRLVTDLIDWIRKWLWANQEKGPQPYHAVRETHHPRGTLKLVTGRQTPRAIATYIFCPKSETSEYIQMQVRPKDWHIYLDWSPNLPEFGGAGYRGDRRHISTHTITILRASHALSRNGEYSVEHVFSGDYEFSAAAINQSRAANMACQYVALLVARWEISSYRWPDEMAQIYYKVTRTGKPYVNTQAFSEFGP